MKRRFSFLGVAFALLTALSCGTPYAATSPTMPSALLTVECRNAYVQQVTQLLRSGRAKDIKTVSDAASARITAAFDPVDTPPDRLPRIIQELHDMDGVLYVNLEENHHPIRQSF